jgi:hypothetical protein
MRIFVLFALKDRSGSFQAITACVPHRDRLNAGRGRLNRGVGGRLVSRPRSVETPQLALGGQGIQGHLEILRVSQAAVGRMSGAGLPKVKAVGVTGRWVTGRWGQTDVLF